MKKRISDPAKYLSKCFKTFFWPSVNETIGATVTNTFPSRGLRERILWQHSCN